MIVSVGIVAYNEEKTLPRLLEDLCNQDYPHDKIEILLIDSMSTDNTRKIMMDFQQQDYGFRGVKVLDNPQKILPCGCNVMLTHYTGESIVRIDAHASVPCDFLSKNVKVLNSGEDVCGGQRPNIIDDDTLWKKTLLIAEQSMFGSSIAPYRHQVKKSYVSSVFHGMYRRKVYDTVGLYNELLMRTEDNDMSYRIRQAGFRICYSPEIISYQHTRNTLKKMLKQKYLNGYWIGKTMGINPKCFSLYHFVPFLFVLSIILTTVLGFLGHSFLAFLMWGAYATLILIVSVTEFVKQPSATNLLLPILFLFLHLSYGIGTLKGLIELPFWLKNVKMMRADED